MRSLDGGTKLVNTLTPTLFALTSLLLFHRYPGIVHDAILYMGEGLAHRAPEIFDRDLFFLHGGQQEYSVMPWLLGELLRIGTPPQVFMWGALTTTLLFAFASWFVLRDLLPERQRIWGWFGIACLPPIYGVTSIFSYNEAFLTSRPIAEALSLLAIGSLVRSRWWLASLCIVAASLLHPLQAITAMLIAWPWMVMTDRRWLHAGWAIAPILLLAFLGLPPFDGMLRSFDSQWLAAARTSNQLFVSQWSLADYKVLFFDAFLLAVGWKLLPARWSRWCIAALAGLALGMGASLLLVDGLHLLLPTGLQLWRVHWLAHWFAIASLGALLFHHVSNRDAGRALILMLAGQLAWGETALGAAWMSCLYLVWPWLIAPPRQRLRKPLTWLFGLSLGLLFANHAINEWRWFAAAGYRLEFYPLDIRLLLFPAFALALPLLGLALWSRAKPNARALLSIGMMPLLLLAAWRWDARSPLVRVIEQAASTPGIFGARIPEDAQVFWEPESLTGTWMVLGRASYYSQSQMAGQMFNRATFIDGRAREEKVRPLLTESTNCLNRIRHGAATCSISADTLRRVCEPGEVPPPDYLVLPYAQSQSPLGTWTISAPGDGEKGFTFRLFDCKMLAAGNASRGLPRG